MKVRKLILGFMATAFLGIAAWAQKPVLKFHADSKKFKIVQFTDLHLKWQDERSEVAYERINQVLDEEKPDLQSAGQRQLASGTENRIRPEDPVLDRLRKPRSRTRHAASRTAGSSPKFAL